jgi:hypothetical protein
VVLNTLKDRKFPLFLLLRSTACLLVICSEKLATVQVLKDGIKRLVL